MTADKLPELDLEWEAEKICRWGAARAGVIVVAPLVGTMALMANEVYMIIRLGELRGVKLDESAVMGLLGSLGATFVGQTLTTLIPFAPVQIPVGISVTYAVGRVANAWLKAGRPEDIASFKEIYEQARQEGLNHIDDFKEMHCKDEPLGDESRRFNLQTDKLLQKVMAGADAAEKALSDGLQSINDKFIRPFAYKTDVWLTAQRWQQLKRGEITVPYSELADYLNKNLQQEGWQILKLGYQEPACFSISVRQPEYGVIDAVFAVESFEISSNCAAAELELRDFSVADNKFAEIALDFLGSELIMGLIDLLFAKIDIPGDKVDTVYEQRRLKIDFYKALQSSRFAEMTLMNKPLLERVQLQQMTPQPEGLQIKVKISS